MFKAKELIKEIEHFTNFKFIENNTEYFLLLLIYPITPFLSNLHI